VRIGNQYGELTTALGYASSADVPLHFGLGAATTVKVEIRWPSGTVQTLTDVKINQVLTMTEK
jgi:hypothetical protein